MPRRLEPLRASTAAAVDTFIFPLDIENAEGERKTVEFEVLGAMPASVDAVMTEQMNAFFGYQDLQREIDGGANPRDVEQRMTREEFGVMTVNFMDMALVPESAQRFKELIADPVWSPKMDDLRTMRERILEEWSGRPTQPSSGSSTGRSTTSATSTVAIGSTPGPTSSPSPSQDS